LAIEASFPDFLHGEFNSLHRRTLKLGKVWAEHYLRNGSFPVPLETPVPSGSVILTADVSDFERLGNATRWRLYFVRRLRSAITNLRPKELDWDAVTSTFDDFTLHFSWGALDASIGHIGPNNLALVSRRVHAVLSFWSALDTLRYVNRACETVTLTASVEGAFAGLIELWSDTRSSDLKRDLLAALERAAAASSELVRTRVARRMAAIARKDDRLSRNERLGDEGWLQAWLTTLEEAELEPLKAGDELVMRQELHLLYREQTRRAH